VVDGKGTKITIHIKNNVLDVASNKDYDLFLSLFLYSSDAKYIKVIQIMSIMVNLQHSERAKKNMTSQITGMLKFLQDDLKGEEKGLAKAKTFLKYDLPGIKQMIARHEAGVRKTKRDIAQITKRIKRLQKEGKINKIL